MVTDQMSLSADTTPPTVSIENPLDRFLVTSRTFTVSGHAFDNAQGSGVESVKVNGATAVLNAATGAFTANLTAPSDGTFQIVATATDHAGNISPTAVVNILIDSTGPVISIDSPAVGAVISGSPITVTGTVTDATTGVFSVLVNGKPATINGTSYTQTIIPQCDSGVITIGVIAIDNANHNSTVVRNVTLPSNPSVQPCITQFGPFGGPIQTLVSAPGQASTFYAGTSNSGVYRTDDSGANWRPVNNGLGGRTISSLVIDPGNPLVLFAGTTIGVFKTIDGGTNWLATNNGLPSSFQGQTSQSISPIIGLAIKPNDGNTVYAVIDSLTVSDIYKTIDGGGNWVIANTGLPDSRFLPVLAVSALSPDTLYLGLNRSSIYKTTNGAANWSATGYNQSDVTAISVDPTNANIVYAGGQQSISKSSDGGNTWGTKVQVYEHAFNDQPLISSIVINPTNSQTIWVGTTSGVYKSDDGSVHWTNFNNGFPFLAKGSPPQDFSGYPLVNALALDGTAPTTLFSGTEFGMFKTNISGASWNSTSEGLKNSTVTFLAFDPVNKSTVYAVTPAGLFKSIDAGGTWTAANSGFPAAIPNNSSARVDYVVVDPKNPAILYAGLLRGGVYKSINGGASWNPANSGFENQSVNLIVIDPNDSNILYSADESGLHKTTNAGATWTHLNFNQPVFAMAIHPTNSNILYTCRSGVIDKSTDGGQTWGFINPSLSVGSYTAIVIDPTAPATIYVGTSQAGVLKTTDSGATFTDHGLTPGLGSVTQLALDLTNSANLYTVTPKGLFRGTASGTKWTPFDLGLTDVKLNTLALKPDQLNQVYVGTDGSGVMALEQSGTVTTRPDVAIITPTANSFTNKSTVSVTSKGVWGHVDLMTT